MGRVLSRLWLACGLCVACASEPSPATPADEAGSGGSAGQAGVSGAAHVDGPIDGAAHDPAMPEAGTSAGGAPGPAQDAATPDTPARDVDAGRAGSTLDAGAPATRIYAGMVGVCAYGTHDFAALQALGIEHARMDRPDAATIDEARKYGVEVLPIAGYGYTDLSGTDDDKAPPLPENRAAWARRVVDLWRDMANPPKVIEVWNEPYGAGFWPPHANAGDYLALFQAFAAEAWAVWPEETLLVAGDTIGSDPDYAWRDELLAADTTGFLNDPRILPTSHPYTQARTPTQMEPEPCKWDLDRFRCVYDAWKAHGHPDPQVWVTEYGWQSITPDSVTGSPMSDLVSEQLQADYVKEALQIFHDSGQVARAYAFLYRSNDKWNYNWVRPDGTEKPVCDTVKQLIATDE